MLGTMYISKEVPRVRNCVDSAKPTDIQLQSACAEFSRIIAERNVKARLTVNDKSFFAGSLQNAEHSVEFLFGSKDIFEAIVSRLSLYGFARAYIDGDLRIEGSMEAAIDILYAINTTKDRRRTFAELLNNFGFRIAKAALPFVARRFESDAHYSMSADAYALFLDKNMQYTCGKFITGNESIDEAQGNKFTLISDLTRTHLGAVQGLNHLDVGCGWGGLLSHFANTFHMNSVGITNNKSQLQYAREQFGVDVSLNDFSCIVDSPTPYDLVTIVGMAEHLTPRRRTELFNVVRSTLRPRGLVYFQCIAKPSLWIGGDAYRIAYEDVFPGHHLETRLQMEKRFSRFGFEIIYVADDALDYAKTTQKWATNLELNKKAVIDMIGEKNYRIFFGYLLYASKLFASGRGSLMRYMLRAPR